MHADYHIGAHLGLCFMIFLLTLVFALKGLCRLRARRGDHWIHNGHVWSPGLCGLSGRGRYWEVHWKGSTLRAGLSYQLRGKLRLYPIR